MNRLMIILVLFLALTTPALASSADAAAIRSVVTSGYVEGVHKEGNPEKMRAGFHADFVMFINGDEGIRTITRDQWIERIEEGNKKADRKRPEIHAEISLVDVTKDAAIARVELHRDGKHTFTDYLSLYRFADGWRIIAKTFYRHP